MIELLLAICTVVAAGAWILSEPPVPHEEPRFRLRKDLVDYLIRQVEDNPQNWHCTGSGIGHRSDTVEIMFRKSASAPCIGIREKGLKSGRGDYSFIKLSSREKRLLERRLGSPERRLIESVLGSEIL